MGAAIGATVGPDRPVRAMHLDSFAVVRRNVRFVLFGDEPPEAAKTVDCLLQVEHVAGDRLDLGGEVPPQVLELLDSVEALFGVGQSGHLASST